MSLALVLNIWPQLNQTEQSDSQPCRLDDKLWP